MERHFSGVVEPGQLKQHITLPFDVPGGVNGIIIHFEYEPHRVSGRNNLLTLTLFDPDGFRGEGHRHEPLEQVSIARYLATPGYFPGTIPPDSGHW
jgi:hypothetical protein